MSIVAADFEPGWRAPVKYCISLLFLYNNILKLNSVSKKLMIGDSVKNIFLFLLFLVLGLGTVALGTDDDTSHDCKCSDFCDDEHPNNYDLWLACMRGCQFAQSCDSGSGPGPGPADKPKPDY